MGRCLNAMLHLCLVLAACADVTTVEGHVDCQSGVGPGPNDEDLLFEASVEVREDVPPPVGVEVEISRATSGAVVGRSVLEVTQEGWQGSTSAEGVGTDCSSYLESDTCYTFIATGADGREVSDEVGGPMCFEPATGGSDGSSGGGGSGGGGSGGGSDCAGTLVCNDSTVSCSCNTCTSGCCSGHGGCS